MIAFGRSLLAAALSLIVGLAVWSVAAAAPTFPDLTGRVVDGANILSPQAEASLTSKLESLEAKTSRQLVIVTVPSLQGYEIEDYGYQLGRVWGIGEKGRDTGVLMIVAPNERRVRIEVGYGLEGVLTDALSTVILQERVLPRFRKGDFEGGVVAGADALIVQLSLPDDEARAKVATLPQAPAGSDKSTLGIILVLLGLWVALGLFGSVTGRPGHRMDLWLLPLLLLMSAGGHGGRGRAGGGGFRGGGGSFGGGGASGGW